MDIDAQAAALRRGVVGVTPEGGLEEKLALATREKRPLVIKLGLDPTAPDIHLGHAVVLRKLRQFQDLGHQVVVIIGDFTAMIGDPSGRNEMRRQLSREEVRANAQTYADQYCRILDPARTSVRFNSEWLGELTFFDVIRLAGKLTVARIMERDDFARRFREQHPIGLHELLYPLCQAYDSVAIKADIEMGGTDQMFNILTGRDLQSQLGQPPQVALFMPLLVGLDGVEKMSKSLGNYVGVSDPPNEMFGKLMSIPDTLMLTYFELATEVDMAEARVWVDEALTGRTNPKDVKRRLAREIVAIYHGAVAAQEADAEFERVHARREAPTEIPERSVPCDAVREGRVWICRLLAAVGFAKGTGEARRLVLQGGVSIGGQRVPSPDAEFPLAELEGSVLQVGNRHFVRLRTQT